MMLVFTLSWQHIRVLFVVVFFRLHWGFATFLPLALDSGNLELPDGDSTHCQPDPATVHWLLQGKQAHLCALILYDPPGWPHTALCQCWYESGRFPTLALQSYEHILLEPVKLFAELLGKLLLSPPSGHREMVGVSSGVLCALSKLARALEEVPMVRALPVLFPWPLVADQPWHK